LVQLFDEGEFGRWYDQARYTLESARRDLEAGDYAWSCFKSQQAAEYATKALLGGLGKLAVSNSITRLLQQINTDVCEVNDTVFAAARNLDRHYMQARYPDAHPSGSPFEFYGLETAREALEDAHRVIDFIAGVMKAEASPLENRRRQRELATARARSYVERISVHLGRFSAILVGSFVRGDFNIWSDIDVLIVSEALPQDPLERSSFLYSVTADGIEPKGYTSAEFREMLAKGNPLAVAAREEGVVLAGEDVWRELV